MVAPCRGKRPIVVEAVATVRVKQVLLVLVRDRRIRRVAGWLYVKVSHVILIKNVDEQGRV